MASREIERLARSMVGQKLDPVYIRHYLQETYQLDDATVDALLEKVGVRLKGSKGMSAKPPSPLSRGFR